MPPPQFPGDLTSVFQHRKPDVPGFTVATQSPTSASTPHSLTRARRGWLLTPTEESPSAVQAHISPCDKQGHSQGSPVDTGRKKEEKHPRVGSKKRRRRTKRQAKVLEENYWDCSVCTYRNTAEAFKCLMCDVRKGTSTRKPRINSQLAAQQYAPVIPQKMNKSENGQKEKSDKRSSQHHSGRKPWPPPRLKNVDRSSAQTREVTVNNITVMITEYKPKVKNSQDQLEQSSVSSESGSQSESSVDAQTDTDSPSS